MSELRRNMLSVVVPVYKGEAFLHELSERVKASVADIFDDYELILVNDASPDDSLSLIKQLCEVDRRIIGLNLSRNFGQHYAIAAGLSFVRGEWCVVMDCDLQDQPEEIPHLFNKAKEGYDSVFAQRVNRQDTFFKRLESKIFYAFFSFMTNTPMDASVANFGVYHRKVVDATLSMGDKLRYFPAMVHWVGFRKAYLPVTHAARKFGSSSYTLFALLRLAMDTILSFSEKPLRLCIGMGSVVTILAFLTACFYFLLALAGYFGVNGFASLMISIFFFSGVQMMMMGVLGIYMAKVFNQVKSRPTFIVADVLFKVES